MAKGKTSLERAINKAMELGTVALKVDARTYTVAASNGRDEYTVTVRGCEYTCTCTAGQQGRTCYHAAAAMMARMSERLEAAAPTVDTREASRLAQPLNSRRNLYGTAA